MDSPLPAFLHPAHAGRWKEQLPSSPHLCNNNQGSAHLWPSASVWRDSSGASCPTFKPILWQESPGIWRFQSTGEVQPQRPGEDAAIGSMKDNPPSESALSSSSTARAVPLAALAVAVLSEPKYFHCIFWEELERSTQSSKM